MCVQEGTLQDAQPRTASSDIPPPTLSDSVDDQRGLGQTFSMLEQEDLQMNHVGMSNLEQVPLLYACMHCSCAVLLQPCQASVFRMLLVNLATHACMDAAVALVS